MYVQMQGHNSSARSASDTTNKTAAPPSRLSEVVFRARERLTTRATYTAPLLPRTTGAAHLLPLRVIHGFQAIEFVGAIAAGKHAQAKVQGPVIPPTTGTRAPTSLIRYFNDDSDIAIGPVCILYPNRLQMRHM